MVVTSNKNTGLTPVEFLVSVSFVAGCIQLLAGVLQLGIIVDFISIPVISGFTTGAALTIIMTQVAGLLGYQSSIDKHNPAYRVFWDTLLNIKLTTIDAAFGIGTIVFLICWKLLAQYFVQRKYRFGVVFGQGANAAALIFFTVIGVLLNMQHAAPIIHLIGSIPSGVSYISVPNFQHMSIIVPVSATVVLVAITEHIAVTKSYARVNGYKIKANQEIWALGCVNIVGSFFGGFPSSGIINFYALRFV
jgi:sodium-independent sulfate anion transporter 11